ncbi:MAG: glycosyltransferase family 87 protein [Candidatus Dormibacteraceae bacterium]
MRLTGEAVVERVSPERRQRWFKIALATFLGYLTLFNLYQTWAAFPHKLVESDFRIWYAAAEIGPRSGWSHLYDTDVQRMAVQSVWPGSLYLAFANPPPAAWVIAPFTLLPFGVALALWTVLSVALLVALSQAYAAPGHWSKAVFAMSAVGFLPTFVMVEAAPLSPVVIGAAAACALLLRRGREIPAGLVLSLIIVKPNIALLVPFAILAGGHLRAFVAWLGATVVMGVISVAMIGTHGLLSFIAVNITYVGETYHLNYSLAALLGGTAPYSAAVVVIVVLALIAAYMNRTLAPEVCVAAGLTASLLINHHLTPADFTLLLIPVWIVIAMKPPPHMRVLASALWAAGWASSIGLAWPVAVMELGLLLGLAIPRGRVSA